MSIHSTRGAPPTRGPLRPGGPGSGPARRRGTGVTRRRLFLLQVLVLALLATLLGRMWEIQVRNADASAKAAAVTATRAVLVAAPRGQILDATGRPFVADQTSFVTSIDTSKLAQLPDRGAAVLARMAPLLHTTPAVLARRLTPCSPRVGPPCWNGSPFQPVPVSSDPRLGLAILERAEDYPAVEVQTGAVLRYPLPAGAQAAQLLGYVSRVSPGDLQADPHRQYAATDVVGRTGLEAVYERDLRGDPGVDYERVDRFGRVIGHAGSTPPRPGDSLVTSLDANVQALLEKALTAAIARANSQGDPATTASGVVLEAQTGRVVAMASLPSYDPNSFVGGISAAAYRALTAPGAHDPLLDRAVQSPTAPGSTFKLVTTAAAVDAGIASFTGLYPCPSSLQVGNRSMGNFEGESFGSIDLHTAIVRSCDTVYYGLAIQQWSQDQRAVAHHQSPPESLQRTATGFGLGTPTGVDLPGEAGGLIEDRATRLASWKALRADYCAGAKRRPPGSYLQQIDAENCVDGYQWRIGDQANQAVGQGTVTVTPLQLATAYAALVNGGRVFSPRLGDEVIRPDGSVARAIPVPVRDRLHVPASVLADIKAAMDDVPTAGTAAGAFAGFPFDRVAVGGKTGTAQVFGHKDTSWFASYAGLPGRPPQLVTVVSVPDGGQGAMVAAPAVHQIWDGIYGLEGHPVAWHGARGR